MAAPTDRVQVVKLERTANGGDDADSDILPAPIDPNEDGLEARGYFVQGPSGVDETTYITRDVSGNMIFRDAVDATERTLTELLGGATADGKDVKVSSNDATPGFLISKLVATGDVTLTELNDGGAEQLQIGVNVSSVFGVQEAQTDVFFSTTSTSFQDAFLGAPGYPLQITEPGDYLVFFESDVRCSNNSGVLEIGVGLNSITAQAGSERSFEGNDRGSNVTIFRLPGLVALDQIYGVYRKAAGGGTAEIRARSITLMRIG